MSPMTEIAGPREGGRGGPMTETEVSDQEDISTQLKSASSTHPFAASIAGRPPERESKHVSAHEWRPWARGYPAPRAA
eukprot:1306226-Pyramimonas_sp.AAC.1